MKYAYPVIITSLDHSRRTTKQYTKAGRIYNYCPKIPHMGNKTINDNNKTNNNNNNNNNNKNKNQTK